MQPKRGVAMMGVGLAEWVGTGMGWVGRSWGERHFGLELQRIASARLSLKMMPKKASSSMDSHAQFLRLRLLKQCY